MLFGQPLRSRPTVQRAAPGWFLATASRSIRAAPNSFTRSGRPTSRWAGCRAQSATPQKPLRADGAVTQNRRLDPLKRGDGPGWRSAGESRPPSVVVPAPDRIGSVRQRLARRAASVAHAARWRRLFSSWLISSTRALTGHRSGGQSQRDGVGRMPQHDTGGRTSRVRRANAVAGGAPVRRTAPQTGLVSLASRTVHASFLFARGFVFGSASPSGSA